MCAECIINRMKWYESSHDSACLLVVLSSLCALHVVRVVYVSSHACMQCCKHDFVFEN